MAVSAFLGLIFRQCDIFISLRVCSVKASILVSAIKVRARNLRAETRDAKSENLLKMRAGQALLDK